MVRLIGSKLILSLALIWSSGLVWGQAQPPSQLGEGWRLHTLPSDLTFVQASLALKDESGKSVTTIRSGSNLQLQGRAQNVGMGPSSKFLLRTIEDGIALGDDQTLGPAMPGQSADFQVAWQATPGRHVINLILDPLDQVRESNEGNNTATITIDVPQVPQFPTWAMILIPIMAVLLGFGVGLAVYFRSRPPQPKRAPIPSIPSAPPIRCPHCGALTSSAGKVCVACGKGLAPGKPKPAPATPPKPKPAPQSSKSEPVPPTSPVPRPGYCPECEREVEADEGFCPVCGRWVGKKEKPLS